MVASLSTDLHAFLTRVSILTWVDAATAGLVCDMDRTEDPASHARCRRPGASWPNLIATLLIASIRWCERSCCPSSKPTSAKQRSALSIERVGRALESTDWATAAWHLREAGDPTTAAQVVDGAINSVFASGQFERARPFLDGSAGSLDRPGALILRSRLELARGNFDQAAVTRTSGCASKRERLIGWAGTANMSSILGFGGFEEAAVGFAKDALRAGSLTSSQRDVALATIAMWDAEHEGPLDSIADGLRDLAIRQSREGHHRYAGITRLNLAGVLLWLGAAEGGDPGRRSGPSRPRRSSRWQS